MLETIRILLAVAPLPPDKKAVIQATLKVVEFATDENQREATFAVAASYLKAAFDEAGVKYEIR